MDSWSFRVCHTTDESLAQVYRGSDSVKPLPIIWNNYPRWGPHNTIMFDDVRRNFVMNPQSGLRIHAFRDAHVNNATDRELLCLANYLELIASRQLDFTRLNHHRWSRYLEKHWQRHCDKRRRLTKELADTEPSSQSGDLVTPAAVIASTSLEPSGTVMITGTSVATHDSNLQYRHHHRHHDHQHRHRGHGHRHHHHHHRKSQLEGQLPNANGVNEALGVRMDSTDLIEMPCPGSSSSCTPPNLLNKLTVSSSEVESKSDFALFFLLFP
ncbi:unnamed protein product [Protopolystoma xenopodis]|uniref:FCP1 homology domain-containing protein n=1 Tax=Protopolystoma xenopodis TaxID=117903 RepID=A0A448XBD4_9PLAT|nr:unnamed protein product [Protopolystoma xenopodis]